MDPMTWYAIAMLALSLIMYFVARPKPQHAKPPELGDFQAPTVEEGTDILMIFGTVWMKSPVVGWYGDLDYEPIRADGGK